MEFLSFHLEGFWVFHMFMFLLCFVYECLLPIHCGFPKLGGGLMRGLGWEVSSHGRSLALYIYLQICGSSRGAIMEVFIF